MSADLYVLDGPLCGREESGSRQTTLCPRCGRGRRRQVRDLTVSLLCPLRRVWLTDANAVLIDAGLSAAIGLTALMFRPVNASWRDDLPWRFQPVPKLLQLCTAASISAAPESLDLADCDCGAVRSISFKPLIVRVSDTPGPWHLEQNPEVLIFDAVSRDKLLQVERDLEFIEVSGGSFSSQERGAGIDWSNV